MFLYYHNLIFKNFSTLENIKLLLTLNQAKWKTKQSMKVQQSSKV